MVVDMRRPSSNNVEKCEIRDQGVEELKTREYDAPCDRIWYARYPAVVPVGDMIILP